MPELDRALEEMRKFKLRPPVEPSTLSTVTERAAQRRRRRRIVAATGCVAVLAVALAAGLSLDGTAEQEVRTIDQPTTATPSTTPRVTTTVPDGETAGLLVEPSTDLVDGQVVNVSGDFDAGTIQGIAICDADGGQVYAADMACDLNVETRRLDASIELTVLRRIRTGNGITDCSVRPGRCVIGIRTEGGTNLAAPISFRDDLDPLPTPSITVGPSSVGDGAHVTVTGTGFEPVDGEVGPNDPIRLVQCIGSPSDDWDDWRVTMQRCDEARHTSVVPNAEGSINDTAQVFAEILTRDGWRPCDPCVLFASAWRQPTAVATLEVTASGPAQRPTVRIVPDGPYEPGQRVRLEGSGFGAGSGPINIGWCAFRTREPETETKGDPNYGHAPCAYPTEGFGVHADADGEFVVETYPLPAGSAANGADCHASETTTCALASHPGEGTLPVFVTPFELRRE